jgi:hypothetical protein
MVTERIQAMLESCTNFPPTIFYNESWLLRLVLDWFSSHKVPNHPLTFLENARWFSEALLPTVFLQSPPGTKLAEHRSQADGVIGHFEVAISITGIRQPARLPASLRLSIGPNGLLQICPVLAFMFWLPNPKLTKPSSPNK